MKKLKELIKNRVNNLEISEIDETYDAHFKIYKKNIYGKFANVNSTFYPAFVVLLIITKIGVDDVDKIGELIENCSLAFSDISYPKKVYEDYYKSLKMIYNHEHGIKVGKSDLILASRIVKKFDKGFVNLYNEIPEKKFKVVNSLKKLFYMAPYEEIFLSVLSFHRLSKIQNDFQEVLSDFKQEFNLSASKKRIKKAKNEAVSKAGKSEIENINELCSIIDSKYKSICSKVQKENKIVYKIKNNYEKLITKLNYNKGYISNIEELSRLIEDEEILNEFLKYVIINNSKYEQVEFNKNIELKGKQVSSIEILFNKYNYNLYDLNEDIINQISEVSDLEEKLKILSTSEFKNLNTIDYLFILLVLNCDLEQLNLFVYLKEANIIDDDFLIKNLSIITNKDMFNNFRFNVSILNNYIYKIVKYDKDILLVDSNLIVKRLKLMKEYYNIEIDTFNKFEFLKNDNIFNLLDNFIELGYYNQIKNNPDYLESSNFNAIKRLQIASLINMDVVNSDNSFIGPIITGNNFYVSDDKLNDFIVDYTVDYIDNNISGIDISNEDYIYISKLSDYEYDNLTYKINNKLLSKNRILRNMSLLKYQNNDNILFNSILRGSINLDNDDISVLNSIIGIKIKVKK